MLTVQEVISATDKDLPGKGMFTSYKLVLQSGETAELFQRQESPPPKAGDQIDGTLEQSQYGLKIKKNAKLGPGGGFRPRDPKDTAAIQRQHSQSVAVDYLRYRAMLGDVPGEWKSREGLQDLIDWFQRDIQRGVNLEMYGSKRDETRKEPVRTGQSDIPSDGSEFVHTPQDMSGTPWSTE